MNKLIRLVAWIEILTGIFMIVDTMFAFFSIDGSDVVGLSKGIFIGLGTLSLIFGIALLRSSKFAWTGSLVVQTLQMPVFLISNILYRPGLGVFIPVGIDLPEVGSTSAIYEFTLGVDFIVSLDAIHGDQYIAINIAALACLLILLLNRTAVRKRV